jgi:integral membrane protein (TIGR01906 family)
MVRPLVTASRWLLGAIFVLAFPVFLVTTNLRYVVNAEWRYREGFEKYQIPQATGIEMDQLMVGARALIAYFNSDQEPVDIVVERQGQPFRLFNEREVRHLYDVKQLLQLMNRINIASGIYLLLYVVWLVVLDRRRFGERLGWSLIGGMLVTLLVLGLIGGLAAIDFESVFVQFHLLSFRNDLWLLDPATDYLIRMYPEGFFYDATVFLALSTILEAVVAGFGAAIYLTVRRFGTPLAVAHRPA